MTDLPLRPFRFGVQAAKAGSRAGVGRAGAALRGLRVLDADDAGPLRRPARAGARADGRRRRDRTSCGSARSCGTTTTSTRSCSPRSWPRSTCSREGRLEIGLGAGWMISRLRAAPASPTTPPKVRIDRFVEGLAVHQAERCRAQPFSFAGQHYTITDFAGTPMPVQAPCPPILIGGGGKRVLRSPPARPTSSASTARCTPGAIGRGTFDDDDGRRRSTTRWRSSVRPPAIACGRSR